MMKLFRPEVVASASGGLLEMYDFMAYAFLGPIISASFFPRDDPGSALILTFGIFAIGYLARPIGGLIYAQFGDTIGRKNTLMVSILGMAVPTFSIGVLPTYQHIGLAAPILLTAVRLLQGLAVGGDLPGATVFVAEHAERSRRGLDCGLVFLGVNVGLVLASLVSSLCLELLPHEALTAWGWRMPFLLGVVIAIVGGYFRSHLQETPAFVAELEHRNLSKIPLVIAFQNYLKQLVVGCGLIWLFSILTLLVLTFMPTYVSQVTSIPLKQVLLINTLDVLLLAVLLPVFGHLSDRYSRKKLLMGSCVALIIATYPIYQLILTGNVVVVVIVWAVLCILAAAFMGVAPCFLVELFDTPVRYTGFAFSYNVSFALFGGTAPLLATILMKEEHLKAAPGLYIVVAAVIALISVLYTHSRRTLSAGSEFS
jgi:MFS family permease